jgi:two-component system, LytTR family, sensor kinase
MTNNDLLLIKRNLLLINRRILINHLKVWCIYLIYIFILNIELLDYYGGVFKTILAILLNHSFCASHFYFDVAYVHEKIFKRQYSSYIILLISSFLIHGIIRYLVNYSIFPFFGIINRYREGSNNFYIDTLWIYVNWFIYGLAYFYARKTVEQEKELRILQVQKAEAEMKFLKAQINPHFMFNTLNLINSKVMKASKGASDIILQLSDMFRYMTGKDSKNDLVALQEEVGFVFNYVDMLNKRNSYSMAVAIDQEGDFSKYQITPMVLITILENAFKHGDVFDHDFPLIITMIIDENNLFTFSTANKIKVEEQKGGDTGIGINNITQRLKAVHGDTFTLNSYLGEQQEYICELTIQY